MTMLAPMELGIAVRDPQRMIEFYRDVLGCAFVSDVTVPADKAAANGLAEEPCTVVRMQTPQGERLKFLAPATPPDKDAHPRWLLERAGFAYLTFIVGDLDARLARLRAANVEIMSNDPPVVNRPGIRVVFFRDPEGNALELVEYDDIQAYRPDLKKRA